LLSLLFTTENTSLRVLREVSNLLDKLPHRPPSEGLAKQNRPPPRGAGREFP
jgi:hypothetical protein